VQCWPPAPKCFKFAPQQPVTSTSAGDRLSAGHDNQLSNYTEDTECRSVLAVEGTLLEGSPLKSSCAMHCGGGVALDLVAALASQMYVEGCFRFVVTLQHGSAIRQREDVKSD